MLFQQGHFESPAGIVDLNFVEKEASSAATPIIDDLLYLKRSADQTKKPGDDTSARAIYQVLKELEGISHRTGSHPEELNSDNLKKNRAAISSTKLGRGGRETIVVRSNKRQKPEPPAVSPSPTKLSLDNVLQTLSSTPLGNPADAPLSSEFGWRISPFRTGKQTRFHSGLDYSVDKYSPVWATADGVVTSAGRCGPYGNCIVVDHGNGYETLYAHLSRFNVVEGASVCRSQAIGQIGSSGRSTGPHLHYEIRKNGVPINPMPFVEAAKMLAFILGEILT
jgi:murein DD-endopeptidase MepM/ murein hydrolase activator NlpD